MLAELWSPLAGIVLAILIRLVSNVVGLLLAWPLARDYEIGLAPRTNVGKEIGIWFDRLHLARAFRSLRWTHHVRQLALSRLGSLGGVLGRLDPIMDATNITLWVAAIVAIGIGAGG
jgi:small-conductance mechanosensitive channel